MGFKENKEYLIKYSLQWFLTKTPSCGLWQFFCPQVPMQEWVSCAKFENEIKSAIKKWNLKKRAESSNLSELTQSSEKQPNTKMIK